MQSIWTALGFHGNPYDQAYLPGSQEGATLFCGRTAQVRRVQVGIASGGSHVSIAGEPGVGKTSLAQVAAYEMFRLGQVQQGGTLFVPAATSVPLGHNPVDFERDVWRSIANALIEHQDAIRQVGLNVPNLGGLGEWLNSPMTLTAGSMSVLGLAAGGGRGLNTSSGFGESGFNWFVRRELTHVFPTTSTGGVVCILDNLELLRTSDAARQSLEAIRASLLEVPSIRWVLVGSQELITSARSRRLSGFIDLPLRLSPLTIDEGVELVRRRLEYWGTERAHAPVQAEDFRHLYELLGLNLRDSLSLAQQFAKDYYMDFVGTGRDLPSDDERPLYFQSWLADKADAALLEAVGVPDDTWKLFDRICAAGGTVSVEAGDQASLARLNPLGHAQLLDLGTDPAQVGTVVGTVTAHGWLCASARPRAAVLRIADAAAPRAGANRTGVDENQVGTSSRPRTITEMDDQALPPSCRLIDVLGLQAPYASSIADRWSSSPGSTEAVVGMSPDGLSSIDLRRDGPHALIAGTTASGRSELLQTIIASFAMVNRPDAMTFLLFNFSGGGAFADCVRLPHTVGVVTNLDVHLAERALTSLSAELRRREHQLGMAGVTDFEEYAGLQDRDVSLPRLPRLLLMIDELAQLVRDLPDFVNELMSIGRRGRVLGIHLLLSTQRPRAVVAPEISANTNLRIALRVRDADESVDILQSPDAAGISPDHPGRAFARLADGTIVPFQSGQVAKRPDASSSASDEADAAVSASTRGRAVRWEASASVRSDGDSDLAALVKAAQSVAARLEVAEQRLPLQPVLPDAVTVSELQQGNVMGRFRGGFRTTTRPTAASPAGAFAIPYGLEDLPDAQEQRPAELDLVQGGHLFGVGSGRSGRSQLLRTLAGSAAERHSSADLHMYAIDCGSGALLPLAELPHCGAVVMRSQVERATRLLSRLVAELHRRQAQLADAGLSNITAQRATVDEPARLPHILVLLDHWEGFTSTLGEIDDGRLSDSVFAMLRDGAFVGIHVVVTGDRSLVQGRIGSMVEDKLVFKLTDRSDYAFVGLNARRLPTTIPAGRCFRAESGVEIQVALLSDGTSGQDQVGAIAQIASAARGRDADVPAARRPFRIAALPSKLSFRQAWDLRPQGTGPLFGLVGVGGDELVAMGPDFDRMAPSFVVAGPPRSGRSTVLLTMAKSLLASGASLIAAVPRESSPLQAVEGRDGLLRLFRGTNIGQAELADALAEAGEAPVAIILDDAEVYRDCDAADILRALVRGTAGPGRAVVLGGSTNELCAGYTGWQVEAKRARQGVLLSPQDATDGDLIGVRLPRSEVGQPVRRGRALLHLGTGQLVAVQVPT